MRPENQMQLSLFRCLFHLVFKTRFLRQYRYSPLARGIGLHYPSKQFLSGDTILDKAIQISARENGIRKKRISDLRPGLLAFHNLAHDVRFHLRVGEDFIQRPLLIACHYQ